ncbi:MAG: hypothetical protein WDN69_14590 [Aliidongia sp.]
MLLSELLPEICRLAEAAGRETLRFYEGDPAATLKQDGSRSPLPMRRPRR